MTAVRLERTFGQRVSIALSVFVGLTAGWWALNHIPESMFGSYERVNEDYRARLEATHVAISGLRVLQQQSGAIGSQATSALERDLTQIGQDYSDALKTVAQRRERRYITLCFASAAAGGFAFLASLLLSWVVTGGANRREIIGAKATVHPVPVTAVATAPAQHLDGPDSPTHQRSS